MSCIKLHSFADDLNRFYIFRQVGDSKATPMHVTISIEAIDRWFNRLQSFSNEFTSNSITCFGSRRKLGKLNISRFYPHNETANIPSTKHSVRNFGIVFDSQLTLAEIINSSIKLKLFAYQLRQMHLMHQYQDAFKTMVHLQFKRC